MRHQPGCSDSFRCRPEDSTPEVIQPNRAASGSSEHTSVLVLDLEARLDGVDDEPRDDDGTGLIAPWSAEDQPAPYFGSRSLDSHPSPRWVYRSYSQPSPRRPQTRPPEEPHEGREVTAFVYELPELVGAQDELWTHVDLNHGPHPYQGCAEPLNLQPDLGIREDEVVCGTAVE